MMKLSQIIYLQNSPLRYIFYTHLLTISSLDKIVVDLWFSALAVHYNHLGDFKNSTMPRTHPQNLSFNWSGV